MNKSRYEIIRKYIITHIKPHDCRIAYKYGPLLYGAYYDRPTRTVYLPPTKCNAERLRLLLHEICHHITWKIQWSRPCCYRTYTEKIIKKERRYRYTSEYIAEKMTRKISKKHKWYEILKASDKHIVSGMRELINGRNFGVGSRIWGWDYAIRRLQKEENVDISRIIKND